MVMTTEKKYYGYFILYLKIMDGSNLSLPVVGLRILVCVQYEPEETLGIIMNNSFQKTNSRLSICTDGNISTCPHDQVGFANPQI